MTTLLVIITLLAVVAPAAARIPAHKQQWQQRYDVWMPKHWQNLAQCEEHLNWRHNDGTYEGGFAFYHGSWDDYKYPGYPDSASEATPWQQWRVALRIAAKLTIRIPWGCWRGPQHAWVRNGMPEYGTRR